VRGNGSFRGGLYSEVVSRASNYLMKRIDRFKISILLLLGSVAPAAMGQTAVPMPLKEAETIAIRNHPRITEAELNALAAKQVTRQARAPFFPSIYANATAVGAPTSNTRIAAGALNSPAIFNRNAEGLSITQTITDFGHTANLAKSAKLHERAQQQNALATREEILMQVDTAYFRALGAQAVLRVAQETVNTRQLLLDQISALATNKLKSDLDVSFAAVALGEGNLLLARATNDLQAAYATFATLLGYRDRQAFILLEEAMPAPTPTNDAALVQLALQQRPELIQLRLERDAATQYALGQRDARFPTISAIGAAGLTPIHDDRLEDTYAAAGIDLSLPIYTGGLLEARQREAELRAKAAEQGLIDEENNIIREVRVAWLNSNNALERWHISDQLLAEARESFELAQARYKGGLSSIVELSQSQLNVTAAEIEQASAKYEYQIDRAILDYQVGTAK
jgi:outer membrane protein